MRCLARARALIPILICRTPVCEISKARVDAQQEEQAMIHFALSLTPPKGGSRTEARISWTDRSSFSSLFAPYPETRVLHISRRNRCAGPRLSRHGDSVVRRCANSESKLQYPISNSLRLCKTGLQISPSSVTVDRINLFFRFITRIFSSLHRVFARIGL